MAAILINSLPPGFRFHPTDEELIHYLKIKVSPSLSCSSQSSFIAELDLYKLDPWELPDNAYFGNSEWFCFSPRDRKYPNGARPKRTAASGYWKATGTDQPILSSNALQCLGIKKVLVFYKGHAPKGTKTNWMMHEYRLADTGHVSARPKGSMRLDDWVLCRIRHKGNSAKLKKESRGNHQNDNFDVLKFSSEDSEALSANGHIQEVITEDLVSDGDFACSEKSKTSLNEALESIKRVLSLGALDEQVMESPNKRPCLVNPSSDCSGNSTIFGISSL